MKTVFCDIDGTLLNHTGDIIKNNLEQSVVLPAVTDVLKQWDRASYKLILTTGRKESLRSHTENQLRESGIFYDQLIMGLPNGDRILIKTPGGGGYGNSDEPAKSVKTGPNVVKKAGGSLQNYIDLQHS